MDFYTLKIDNQAYLCIFSNPCFTTKTQTDWVILCPS